MSDIIVPSNPKDLEDINKVITDVSHSMTRQESEADYQKEVFKELEEKYNIKAKHFRRMARDYHKDQFTKNMTEVEDYQVLYENVFKKSLVED